MDGKTAIIERIDNIRVVGYCETMAGFVIFAVACGMQSVVVMMISVLVAIFAAITELSLVRLKKFVEKQS